MNNFDLNIANYKKGELEEMFELPPGNYDVNLVEKKVTQLRTNVTVDKTVDEIIRAKTVIFLEEAKKMLLAELNSSKLLQKIGKSYNKNHELQSSPVIDAGETFIIDKPKSGFSNSFPSEFYPGVINPLKKRTTRQNLNIDTRFRNNYYGSLSSNFNFDLPIKFLPSQSKEIVRCKFKYRHLKCHSLITIFQNKWGIIFSLLQQGQV